MTAEQGARRPKTARASERLRRLLVIVPYLVRHPGSELTEVAPLFGVAEDELVEDLGLLFVSGLPPYGPGDLIGVDIEEGRVWIDMADYFGRPLRLTRSEALALYLRGSALAAMPGIEEATALGSALAKLAAQLEALGEPLPPIEVAPGGQPAETLEALREAVAAHERLRIEYHARSSGETTTREIDPEELFSAIGCWYVVAWDHLRDEERMFRADRIRSVDPTGDHFEPRGLAGAGRPLYTHSDRDVPVRLLLRPDARWVAEYYEVDEVGEREDGTLEAVLPASRLDWVARLVLRMAGEIEVIGPKDLRARVRELAEATLARYR